MLLSGCGQGLDGVSPSSWFGGTVAQDDQVAKNAHPGFGKGPLAPPKPAPTIPVQASSVAPGIPAANGKVKVAILLPLSGNNAPIGQAMLNAAQMAVFDTAPENFELMPRDTAGKGGAQTAAHEALENGAQLLIGPLFASEITAVRGEAFATEVPVLSLSSDTSLKNRLVYVMGFAPAAQVERVVAYANQRGLKRFAALVPATAYGTVVGQAFQTAVSRAGGSIVAYETYSPTRRDSLSHVYTLAMLRKQVDAIFLPESGADLALIAGQLSAAGFDNQVTHFLGTGLWDEPGLARTQSFLIGGWYAAPDLAARRNFIENYKKAYNQEPIRLTTLAYDTTALASALAKHGARFYDEATLTNPNGFAGLDGIFRLTADGGVERGLAINEVTADGSHVIESAPSTFASANYEP